MGLKIAARKSDLARIQAYKIGNALKSKNPDIEIEYVFRSSLGDRNEDLNLAEAKEKGVFTQDFYQGLVDGEFDMVVHSWKDLPIEDKTETEIVATIERADVRDIFLLKKSTYSEWVDGETMNVLTSSPRREYNLGRLLRFLLPVDISGVRFQAIRGNVTTRVKRFLESEADGLVMAKAALDRILEADQDEFSVSKKLLLEHMKQVYWMILPLVWNPPAPAQGALAVEIKKDREDLKDLLHSIDHPEVRKNVEWERSFLSQHGGGCHQRIGAHSMASGFGELRVARGCTETGEAIDHIEQIPVPTFSEEPEDVGAVFPLNRNEAGWFERKPFDYEDRIDDFIEDSSPIWVAKAEAWPHKFCVTPDRVVWSSGMKTWEKLAKKGIWVHGSAEALGEGILMPNFSLVDDSKWIKLTHTLANDTVPSEFKVIPTYHLEVKEYLPDLKGKTHFYWHSATGFFEAKKNYPDEIAKGFHACGPGNTYQALSKEIQESDKLKVFYRFEDWLNQFFR